MEEQGGRIGNLPANINVLNPTPRPDAKRITELVKHGGRVEGYKLSNGEPVTKEQGVQLAKEGGIAGVAVAARNGNEYLRSLPDGQENNNLGNLPSVREQVRF